MTWVVAILGILISFLVKYGNRKNKKSDPSVVFWLVDNWPELLISLLSMIILLIIFGKAEFDNTFLSEKYPWIKSVPIDLIAAALAGYLNNSLWYSVVKKFKGK